MISVSDPPSCTRTRKYARGDIPITVGTFERKSPSSGGAVAILGVTVTNALERLFGNAARKSSGLAPDRGTGKERGSSRPRVNYCRFSFEKHTPCYPVALTALCRARPRNDGSSRTFGSGAISIRSAGCRTAGLGESWLVAHEEAERRNFPPRKALKSHKMGKESHRLARPDRRGRLVAESLNLIGSAVSPSPLWPCGEGRGRG
jgi:hypothetical protein